MARSVAITRTERSIARARAALAACAWLLVWVYHARYAPQPALTHGLLAAYLAYAVAFAATVRGAPAIPRWWPTATHVLDVVACTVWLQLTSTLSGPVIAFFMFILTAATLRWRSAGALTTGGSVLLALPLLTIVRQAPVEWPVFLDSIILLAVVTGLIAYLGAVHEQHSLRLESLVGWPMSIPTDRPALAREVIDSAARLLQAPRLLLVWEEREEPWVDVAFWDAGRFSWRQEPPGTFGEMILPDLQDCSFVCYDASNPDALVFCVENGSLRTTTGAPLSRILRNRFKVDVVASCPVRAGNVDGRLFCFDRRDMSVDDLFLGKTLAALIATRLSHAQLLNELSHRATLENRERLARDLHDGVLQALTGAALQLQAARRLLDKDAAGAAARLDELQQILAAEHAEIRSFISDLQPPAASARGEVGLGGQLGALTSRIRRQWSVDVQLAIEPEPLLVPDTIAPDVFFLVHEAIVNAARHAKATRVSVAILQTADRLSMVVADDGYGFGFEGRSSGEELASRGLGPRSIRERVATLGGNLIVESSASGTRVEIDLPIAARVP